MDGKDQLNLLIMQIIRLLVTLFSLFLINAAIGMLPFASELAVFNNSLAVSGLLNAVLSMLAVIAVIRAGFDSEKIINALLPWFPEAGRLAVIALSFFCALFAYYAFQPAVFPFIKEFEWLYKSLFLAMTVFLLAKAGLHIYYAGENISKFVLSVFNPKTSVDKPGNGN